MGACLCKRQAGSRAASKRLADLASATPAGSNGRSFIYPEIGGGASQQRIHALFDSYRLSSEDYVGPEGLQKLCADLRVAENGFEALTLSWACQARQMGRLSREEWVRGLHELHAESLATLRSRLDSLSRQLGAAHGSQFCSLYQWAFDYALPPGQRCLGVESACRLWQLCFERNPPALLKSWTQFVQASPVARQRGIPKDTWQMWAHFVATVGQQLDRYSAEDAWPTLIDDFVDSELSQQRKQ